ADQPNALRTSRHAFASATAFGQGIFIQKRTRGCRVMSVVAQEQSRAYMVATFSRTPTPLAKGKTRNGSTLCVSTRVISGDPTQIQTLAYRWMHGSHTWNRPSKHPNAYCASYESVRCKR